MSLKKQLVDEMLEEDVVAYIIEKPHVIPEVIKIIGPTAFTDSLLKATFTQCSEFFSEGKPFTKTDLFRALKPKEKELGIASSGVLSIMLKRSMEVEQACMELKELEVRRKLSSISEMIGQGLFSDSDSSTILTDVEDALSGIANNSLSTNVIQLADVYDQVLATMIENAGKTGFSGVDTGSRKLNYVLGGWQPGFIVVAARPSMGKTIVGLEHAISAAKAGTKVLFISLEMSTESLVFRMISSQEPDYQYSAMASNRITPQDVEVIRKSNARVLKQLPIEFYDDANRNIDYLSQLISSKVRKEGFGLVIIDYLQLIEVAGAKSEYEEVTTISRKISKLKKKLKVPIIALAQLSRTVEARGGRKPQLSDLRATGAIEQDADVVIMLYRDDYYKHIDLKPGDPPVEEDNELMYIVAKQRNGAVGGVKRFVDITTNRVVDEKEMLEKFVQGVPALPVTSINTIQSTFESKNSDPPPF